MNVTVRYINRIGHTHQLPCSCSQMTGSSEWGSYCSWTLPPKWTGRRFTSNTCVCTKMRSACICMPLSVYLIYYYLVSLPYTGPHAQWYTTPNKYLRHSRAIVVLSAVQSDLLLRHAIQHRLDESPALAKYRGNVYQKDLAGTLGIVGRNSVWKCVCVLFCFVGGYVCADVCVSW